jgi:hypothetical protein
VALPDEVKYESKFMATVRGTKSVVVSRMAKDGWELVGEDEGRLKVTLHFQRPNKPINVLLVGGIAAAAVLIGAAIGVGAALESGDENPAAGPSTPAASESTPAVGDGPSGEAATELAEPSTPETLTPENDETFAAILAEPDNCSDSIAAWAEEHEWTTIQFGGSIGAMANHEDYDTRYDILVLPGDDGSQTSFGPSFQFRDVSMFDLHLTGDVPDMIGVDDKLAVTAEVVGEIKPSRDNWNCLVYLDPVSTEVR